MRLTTRLSILPLLFPAFSVSALFIGLFIHSRLEFILLIFKSNIRTNRDILFLFFISLAYIPLALAISTDFSSAIKFISLPLAYAYILFFISNEEMVAFFKNDFFKLSLILNIIYCIYQYVVYYSGFPGIAMLHSNLPGQDSYIIPHDNFLRISGLFNENSQFAFYLAISCIYLKDKNFGLYLTSIFMLIITGSKFSLIFVLLHLLSLNKRFFYVFLALIFSLAAYIIEGFSLVEFESFLQYLQYSPMNERLDKSEASFSSISYFGSGTLDGWDIISYHINGYGIIFGSIILLLHLKILLKSSKRFDLILIFIISLTSHGALSILPHTLLLLFAIIENSRSSKELI